MKILEMTLTNFARVFSGLGKTKIELDFRNIEESINLFIGDNGSGKTSIMRCLHPFAYNSAIGDSTSNSDLIISGKDGKKTILIETDDEKEYYIQHIYMRKKDESISVKSFIQEDGIELNDSGTVSTFHTVVLEKIGIDQTYLTLLSIGNTVKGFVDFTASDRKNYASKIFTDLEIYGKYYKNLTSIDRGMKTLLNNVTSKLSKYSGINKEDLIDELNTCKRNIVDLTSRRNQIIQSIGGINAQLSNYSNEINDFESYQNELTQLLSDIGSYSSKLVYFKTTKECNNKINELTTKITEDTLERDLLKGKVSLSLDMKTSKMKSLESIEDNLSKIDHNENVSELEDTIKSIDNDMGELASNMNTDTNIGLSKADTIKASMYLDELKSICDNLLLDVINQDKIVELWVKYKKNPGIITSTDSAYQYALNDVRQHSAIIGNKITVKLPNITHECKDEKCPYKAFYENYLWAIKANQNDASKKAMELERKASILADALTTYSIFQKALYHIKKYEDILNLVPESIFSKDQFIKEYMDKKSVYNIEKLSAIIDTMESKEKYQLLKDKKTNYEDKLNYYKSNINLYDSLELQKDELNKDIERLDQDYREKKEEFDKLDHKVSEQELDKIRYTDELDILVKIDEINSRIMELKASITKMNQVMTDVQVLKDKLYGYQNKNHELNQLISNLNTDKDQLSINLSNIETLQREEIEIREKYDKVSNVRFAVSPTTGIPLEFIEYYIKEEMIVKINPLLDSVFHGRLRLLKEGVIVDDKSFVIPYIKDNTTVISDISKASDGERAILSIVFSLVLIQLTTNKYNIMLLDEIDTTLDQRSRAKFIDLIEEYMLTIHAKQLFLISHNNMFDSYPVNVIMTSDIQSFNYSNAHTMRLYA